jgi:D-sedoheptulose 7-phosphate isomerase
VHALRTIFDATKTPGAYSTRFLQHMGQTLAKIDGDKVGQVVEAVASTHAAGKAIYVIANGGSAAVGSHFVNDLGVNCLVPGKPGFRVFCLADNVEAITAVANDSGYENIFLYQLRCVMQPGDLVLAMSVSGNSPNILKAVEYAKANGGRTVGLCGFDGGTLKQAADVAVHIPSSKDEYGPVEDAFSVICHIVSGYLAMSIGRPLHH